MITENTTVVTAGDLTSAALDDGTVVLDLKAGKYFNLNEVGTRILELISTSQRVGDLIETLLREYDVPRAQLQQDVVAFLEDMERQQLIRVEHGTVA
jgi:hypothetical protein